MAEFHPPPPPPPPRVLPFSAVAPPLFLTISRRSLRVTLDTIFEEDSLDLLENQCFPTVSASLSTSSCFFQVQKQHPVGSIALNVIARMVSEVRSIELHISQKEQLARKTIRPIFQLKGIDAPDVAPHGF
ncbi:hypothetical protein H6P81_016699 [Aristolochia fimbriata]|uniref:Uncharacterized protein n=1 Tax=Aristolochia fimbriata TaxID=158543 RepID=A0AAV7EAQ8_ARIFI|nr:hypothetical protein H6P81_016699 [Aristolochia fimbriata]